MYFYAMLLNVYVVLVTCASYGVVVTPILLFEL